MRVGSTLGDKSNLTNHYDEEKTSKPGAESRGICHQVNIQVEKTQSRIRGKRSERFITEI